VFADKFVDRGHYTSSLQIVGYCSKTVATPGGINPSSYHSFYRSNWMKHQLSKLLNYTT
jgi:hypothetical protein